MDEMTCNELLALNRAGSTDENHELPNGLSIWTDGSCWNGKGGWAYVIIDRFGSPIFLDYGRVPEEEGKPVGIGRAELYAIYKALEHLRYGAIKLRREEKVYLFSDSSYAVNALSNWAYVWKERGWITSTGDKVANAKLVQGIMTYTEKLPVSYCKVKGHIGHVYNELADHYASIGRKVGDRNNKYEHKQPHDKTANKAHSEGDSFRRGRKNHD